MLKKIAVDSAAEDYWTEYFADSGYGEELTREIPRKVHAEFERGLTRAAKKHGVNPKFSQAYITPLAYQKTQSGARFEGAIALTAAAKGKPAKQITRAFCAQLDASGKVQRVDFKR